MQNIPIFSGIKALIFDLDGTIVDSMPAHYIAWREALRNENIEFTPDLFLQFAGVTNYRIIEKLNGMFGKSMDPVKKSEEKENIFLKTISRTRVVEPVADIIRQYHGILPMSVGTGGHRAVAEKTLKVTGMDYFFDIMVTADDITHPKPHPETFLKCVAQMDIAPEYCQVFEDGTPGIKAAEDAGMKVVDVTKYYQTTIGEGVEL